MAGDSARAARLTWLSRGLLGLAVLASAATGGILVFVAYLVAGAYSGGNAPTNVAPMLFPVAMAVFVMVAVPAMLVCLALWLLHRWAARRARAASAVTGGSPAAGTAQG